MTPDPRGFPSVSLMRRIDLTGATRSHWSWDERAKHALEQEKRRAKRANAILAIISAEKCWQ